MRPLLFYLGSNIDNMLEYILRGMLSRKLTVSIRVVKTHTSIEKVSDCLHQYTLMVHMDSIKMPDLFSLPLASLFSFFMS